MVLAPPHPPPPPPAAFHQSPLMRRSQPPCTATKVHALRRETFQAQIGQDAHYLAAVTNCYTLAQAKATLEGPAAFAAIRELLADCHEELSLHAFYAEVHAWSAPSSTPAACSSVCSYTPALTSI